MTRTAFHLLATTILAMPGLPTPEAHAQLAQGCWRIHHTDTSGGEPRAMEALCMATPTSGYVEPGSLYGMHTQECSRVSARRSPYGLTITVDLADCDSIMSYVLTCPRASGDSFECTLTFKGDNSRLRATVTRER